ncbi:MAG: FIST C-terminal domain-containing protein [Neptuniibacter sp.]
MGYFRSGCSTETDASKAVEQIYDAVMQDEISLIIFFCSQDYSLQDISEQIADKFSGIEVVGCTSSGCIGREGYQNKGIVACSFSAEAFSFSVQLVPDVQEFSYHLADALVSDLKDKINSSRPEENQASHFFALQFIDGLSLREETFTQILSTALNGIPLLGGSAGDDLKFQHTYIYYGGAFHSNAGIVILGETNLRFQPFMIQHFLPTEKRLVVTESIPEKRIVISLNGLPAAMEYARNVGCTVEELNSEVFASHPVLVKLGDHVYVRSIQQVNDDGTLTFFCAIDDGVVLSVAEAEEIVENLEREMNKVKLRVGDLGLVIGFDCVFRYLEIEQQDQVGLVSDIFKKNAVFGFNSYGEQFSSMHVNQTFTGIAFSSEVVEDDGWSSCIVI